MWLVLSCVSAGRISAANVWVEAPRLIQNKKAVCSIPFTKFAQKPDNYNYWIGCNLSTRSWPMWKLEFNGETLFEGNISTALQCGGLLYPASVFLAWQWRDEADAPERSRIALLIRMNCAAWRSSKRPHAILKSFPFLNMLPKTPLSVYW